MPALRRQFSPGWSKPRRHRLKRLARTRRPLPVSSGAPAPWPGWALSTHLAPSPVRPNPPGGIRPSAPRRRRSRTSSTTSEVEASPPRSKVRIPSAAAPSVARRMAAAAPATTASPCAAWSSTAAQARSIAIGLATFLPISDGAVPCGASAMATTGCDLVVERQQHGLGAGDGAEQGQHEIREAVPVAVEGRDRPAGCRSTR